MIERDVILHCHIFKNAGTTLDWALERNFKKGFYDHRDDEKMRRDGINHIDEFLQKNPNIVALSSHHMPFMPEHNDNFWWLVLVREPIRRVRSVYEFEVKQKPALTPGSKMAKKLNLAEYIDWRMQDEVPSVIRNFHIRSLTNTTNPVTKINTSFLDKALQRLSLSNVLVGTVEKFDESMIIFEESLKEKFPEIDLSYLKQNVGRKITGSPTEFLDDLPAITRDTLLEKNQMDIRLHEFISEKQNNLIGNIPGVEEKLRNFKERCEALSVKKNV